MHTTVVDDLRFHHNGDFSGPVYFSGPVPGSEEPAQLEATFAPFAAAAAECLGLDDDTAVTLTATTVDDAAGLPAGSEVDVAVPLRAVRTLVGKRVRSMRIEELEQMTFEELCETAAGRELSTWSAQ